jgi:hypothetical protein
VLATGAAYAAENANPNLYVVSIDAVTGTQQWSITDNSLQPNFDVGIGVLVAHDGGILVSADDALVNSSSWTLLRITGPFTDDIFANSFEP